jgi:uncharacterized iron-regulated membrane protein
VTQKSATYRTLWRWHFYAGLFVMPFVLMLSLTGAIYLFKPQLDHWEERNFQRLPVAKTVPPSKQVEAALLAYPNARLQSYRIPQSPGDAALVHIELADERTMRDVFVAPQGHIIGRFDPEARIADFVARVHSSLLIGDVGRWLVELAASWAIVMILSGLYLWWPEGRGFAGVLWPRLTLGRQAMLRDLHAVTGFWVSGLALTLLITGMPWASVWGEAFKAIRTEMGWVQGRQDWKIGVGQSSHRDHNHNAMAPTQAPPTGATIDSIVAKARKERLAFPVIITPLGDVWTAKSVIQNRSLGGTITYDNANGMKLFDERFADKHPIDRVVGYSIAWHEGQLFGWINQLVGVLTAFALMTMTVSGFVLWRRRRPEGMLGAPPIPRTPVHIRGVAAIIITLAALLPLLAASLILLWFFERLILPRLPRLALWLGIKKTPVFP